MSEKEISVLEKGDFGAGGLGAGGGISVPDTTLTSRTRNPVGLGVFWLFDAIFRNN